ncbi:MAG: DUF3307 domain-containing protein [Ignavibacterium sp.]
MESIQIKILIILVSAHFLGDFVFQTDNDVKRKRSWLIFLKHIFFIASLTYLILGVFNSYVIILIVVISHIIIDLIKLKIKKDNIWIFIVDQSLHLLILLLISLNYKKFLTEGDEIYWEEIFGNNFYMILILITSIIVLTKVSGILISYLIKPLQINVTTNENKNEKTLPQTGKIIGYLERIIIYISVLSNVPALIGFLITAKSILRYSEIKNENDKLFVEYILIGTLFSFSLGISFSYLSQKVIEILRVNL